MCYMANRLNAGKAELTLAAVVDVSHNITVYHLKLIGTRNISAIPFEDRQVWSAMPC